MIHIKFSDYADILLVTPILLLILSVLLYGMVYCIFSISDYLERKHNDE